MLRILIVFEFDLVNGKVLSLKETYWCAVKILNKKSFKCLFRQLSKISSKFTRRHNSFTVRQIKRGPSQIDACFQIQTVRQNKDA